jgi:hypothetical protein
MFTSTEIIHSSADHAAWKSPKRLAPDYVTVAAAADPPAGVRPLTDAANEYAAHRINAGDDTWHGTALTDIANTLASWTVGTKMLTYTPGTFLGFAGEGKLILVEDTKTGGVVGAGAITAEYPNGQVEVGAMIVDPLYRHTAGAERQGKGVGVVLALALSQAVHDGYPGHEPIAFANPFSHAVFALLGATDLPGDRVDPAAFGLCTQCPTRPPQPETGGPVCCDQPVSLAGAPTADGLFDYAVVGSDLVFWKGEGWGGAYDA